MKIKFVLLIALILPVLALAQPVQFNLSNKATMSMNGTDTLLYPFIGGLNAPQFNKIDMDGDGTKDLFVFDRAGSKAMTFLFKNGSYVYTPAYESMFPTLYKWVVFFDYDKDGKEDIFSEVDYNVQPEKDKYVSSNGIRMIKNVTKVPGKLQWLQTLNQLMDTGLDILPASNLAVSNTDYSAFNDIDNDGDMDILLMPFGKNVITYYQNLSQELGYGNDSLKFVFRDECWGYASYLVNKNGFYLNDNSSCYRNYKTAKHNGTTLTLFDSDNDGDKDLIYGDVSYNSLVFLKNGRTIMSIGRDSMIAQDTLFPSNSVQAKVELFPASYIVDVNEDGKKDLIVAPNAESAAKNNNQVLYYKNTGTATVPVFTYQSNNFIVGQTLDLGGGSIPNLVDLDGDKDLDLVIATQGEFTQTFNSKDNLVLFENKGTSSKAKFVLADTNFLHINDGTPKIQRMSPTFGDLNGDGKADLIIGDLNGKIHFYENTSVGSSISFNKVSSNYFGIFGGTSATPQLFDLNKDGKLDLIIGRKNGSLVYFENSGSATAPNFTATATIDSIGKVSSGEKIISGGMPFYFDGYSAPHVCDLDRDGRFEVLVGSDMGRVFLFNNFEASASRISGEVGNIFSDAPADAPSDLFFGWKSTVASGDLDGDSIPEIIIGNQRGGIRMYQTQIKGIISGLNQNLNSSMDYRIYPNPVKGELQVRTGKNVQGMNYTFTDIMGHTAASGTLNGYEHTLDVSSLPAGFYILRCADSEGNLIQSKILVQE